LNILAALGSNYKNGDVDIINFVKIKIQGSRIYDFTTNPEEIYWWIDFCTSLQVDLKKKNELLLHFPKNLESVI